MLDHSIEAARRLVERARRSLRRHEGAPPWVLGAKLADSAVAMALAPLYLRGATQVGSQVRTFGRPRIQNFGRLLIGDGVVLRSVNVPLELCTEPGAELIIGDDCSLNYGVSLGATRSIVLGERVRMGPYVMVVDSAFHDLHDRSVRPEPKPVRIEDDVWIAAKASVLPGVTIGRASVVGASAVVTHDVPPMSVVAGVPARVVKHLDPEQFRANTRKG